MAAARSGVEYISHVNTLLPVLTFSPYSLHHLARRSFISTAVVVFVCACCLEYRHG